MKKIKLVLFTFFITIFICSFGLVHASGELIPEPNEVISEESHTEKIEISGEKGNGSSTTINNLTSKDKEIDRYTEALGGNRFNGTALYYLQMARKYSYPIIFVLLVIASLNYFIIGNKKLDKRENGFRMLVTLIIGLIVFQILPLLFSIVVRS